METGTIDELIGTVDALSHAQRVSRLAEVELAMRRLEAETAVLVRALDRDRGFRADGHLTTGGFLRGEFRWSKHQVAARRRLATLVTEVPAVIEHLHAGAIGVAQAHAFGRAAANPWFSAPQDPQQRWPLPPGRITVGSAASNSLPLPKLAPQHAEIRRETQGYVLYDLSGGQTWVNNQPVLRPTLLPEGTTVQFGTYAFHFHPGSP